MEATAFLRCEGEYADAVRPDLNLSRKDGREVLAELKIAPALKIIPVVVLTTSASDEDILKPYRLHANCYIAKPVGFDGFMNAVKSIENFWLSIVRLPSA